MKAKKAVKRLTRVEALLSNVIDQYAESRTNFRDLLDAARESVARAKKTVVLKASKSTRKPPVKAPESKQRRLSAAGRKRLSIAAKKRWALAKRKGVHAITGQRLSKTA